MIKLSTPLEVREYNSTKKDSGKEQAKRFNSDKIDPSQLPPDVEMELAKVFTFGGMKYGRDNWKKGQPVSELVACLKRHLNKYLMGESYDVESGVHHMSHAMWNCMALMWHDWHTYLNRPELDDRDKRFNKMSLEFTQQMKEWMEKQDGNKTTIK